MRRIDAYLEQRLHVRIGLIAHLKYAIAEPFAGGLEMHTFLLARSLRERGHDVTVFASTRSDPALGVDPICGETALSRVGTAEAIDVPFFLEHHAYLALMTRLRHADFDVIHNNALHYLPVAMADSLRAPMVTTLHTPPFCWLESGIRAGGGGSNTFVAVSESVQRAWSAVTAVPHVILNGIDLSRFTYAARPDAAPYLVWYGRIVPEKGLHLAIDAAAQLGLPLRFAGPVSDDDYFTREIRPRLTDGAIYMGHLNHTELAPVIQGARAFLCTPCWEEPYGLVVAEALACGTPVAGFRRGAIPEILTLESGALASPDDAGSLAEAATRAMALSRRACRERAESFCDAELMVDNYERLYRSLIGGPASVFTRRRRGMRQALAA